MSVRCVFACDGCGATGDGVPGDHTHPDPPKGWVWFWGSEMKTTGPHACSDACWRKVCRTPDGKFYLPDSHERRADDLRRARERNADAFARHHPGSVAAPERPTPTHQSLVYFMQRGDAGAVKIGFSRDPERRRVQLQPMVPETLRLLATCPGGRKEEQRLHLRFRQHCVHGEWFNPAPEILEHIQSVLTRTS